ARTTTASVVRMSNSAAAARASGEATVKRNADASAAISVHMGARATGNVADQATRVAKTTAGNPITGSADARASKVRAPRVSTGVRTAASRAAAPTARAGANPSATNRGGTEASPSPAAVLRTIAARTIGSARTSTIA